ncbi:MAG: GTP-binding protein [Candidatus Omnitrophica bacterium]|nr:GTP-binding protein [Candidatus Omnitrophota bacterium]
MKTKDNNNNAQRSTHNAQQQLFRLVIVGHVDHGKSTVVGRLLADTKSLPQGKLEAIEKQCRDNCKPFEYAFLIDALKDERSQGITIDSARVFFNTKKRKYLILDAPGHIEFLKNMVTGASHAESALLVIDAKEGVRENSKRHGFMLGMLGVKQIAVVVNKMDLVKYKKDVYDKIVKEYEKFLRQIGIKPYCFVPVSAIEGDNILHKSQNMPWYNKHTVVEILDLFKKEKSSIDLPLRMPVQDVYKFTKNNDDRRIIAGTVFSGSIKKGDNIVFSPSGKKTTVKKIESFPVSKLLMKIDAGYAGGITLDEQLYVKRGEVISKQDNPPKVTNRIRVSVFWLGKAPFVVQKHYVFKLAATKTKGVIESINKVIDASTLKSMKNKKEIQRHDVAECIINLEECIACDTINDSLELSRFVILDDHEISGGGIIREVLQDDKNIIDKKLFTRNIKWEKSFIPTEKRQKKYGQEAELIIFTGPKTKDKKTPAKELEQDLFNKGKIVYFLGIGNVLYGVDADIKGHENNKKEHIRRFAEVLHILLDAGMIVIVTATNLSKDDIEFIQKITGNFKTTVNYL